MKIRKISIRRFIMKSVNGMLGIILAMIIGFTFTNCGNQSENTVKGPYDGTWINDENNQRFIINEDSFIMEQWNDSLGRWTCEYKGKVYFLLNEHP